MNNREFKDTSPITNSRAFKETSPPTNKRELNETSAPTNNELLIAKDGKFGVVEMFILDPGDNNDKN